MMNVLHPLSELSNPGAKPCLITVVVIVVLAWPGAAEAVGAYTDVIALAAAASAGVAARRRTMPTPRGCRDTDPRPSTS